MKTYCFILHYEGLSAAVKQSRDDNVMIMVSAFIRKFLNNV